MVYFAVYFWQNQQVANWLHFVEVFGLSKRVDTTIDHSSPKTKNH